MTDSKEWAGGEVLFAGGTDWAMVRLPLPVFESLIARLVFRSSC